jgi:anaphase-promoting complex subunit 4
MAAQGEEKSFRRLEDVGCPADILAMKWSPKMDLIAVITAEGAVWLNRLSWQRVWTLRSSDYKAISLAWRPDGKVLALGLDNGKVHLVNVENSEALHEYDVGSKPQFLDWVLTNPPCTSAGIFTEKGDTLLPRLPHLPSGGSIALPEGKARDGPWDPKRLRELTGTLGFLIIGDENAVVTSLVNGLLPVGRVNVGGLIEHTQRCRVVSASLHAHMQFLTIVMQTSSSSDFNDGVISIVTFDTKLYSSRSEELEVLSLKYGQISSLLTYLDSTFAAMSEAWEDILLEIDSRLERYADSLGPETSVSEEFLTLFTCGTSSPELQIFLVNDLTEKGWPCNCLELHNSVLLCRVSTGFNQFSYLIHLGLKKLGKTVESSYSNIQNLALKNLQSGSNALLFHLNDLMGMARWYDRFGILGLSDAMVTECLKILGSLMLKTQELLGVIESALQSFVAFFKWLYLVILQLLDEEVPAFVKKFNQEDVSLVAEFLHCQLGHQEKGKTRFSMERVGQYLKKEPLLFEVENSENIWKRFLDTCPELCDTSYIFTVAPEKSLASLYDELKSCIGTTFEKLIHTNDQSLPCNLRIPLTTCVAGKVDVSELSSQAGAHHWITIANGETVSEKLHLVRLTAGETGTPIAEGMTVGFQGLSSNDEGEFRISVVDFGFYDDSALTLLLRREGTEENGSDLLTQFKFQTLEDSQLKRLTTSQDANVATMAASSVDASEAVVQRRNLERMKAVKVAVSGSRKVACVLSTSRTRVKLFDMDADDEEADDTIDELQSSAMSTDSGV